MNDIHLLPPPPPPTHTHTKTHLIYFPHPFLARPQPLPQQLVFALQFPRSIILHATRAAGAVMSMGSPRWDSFVGIRETEAAVAIRGRDVV